MVTIRRKNCLMQSLTASTPCEPRSGMAFRSSLSICESFVNYCNLLLQFTIVSASPVSRKSIVALPTFQSRFSIRVMCILRLVLYTAFLYIFSLPLSFSSSPGPTILTREQQYCRFSLVIHTLYVRIYSRFPPHTTAKNPPRICTFSATSTGGFSHFGAITPRRLPCVRRSS